MSVFTDDETPYIREQTLARLAIVGGDGQPPVSWGLEEHGAVGGQGFPTNSRSVRSPGR